MAKDWLKKNKKRRRSPGSNTRELGSEAMGVLIRKRKEGDASPPVGGRLEKKTKRGMDLTTNHPF